MQILLSLVLFLKDCGIRRTLRWNPPDIRVTSGQKPSTKIIYIVLQTSVWLFWISSQRKSFLATPNVENGCWTSYETLESSGEMKLMMKFCLCLHKISELWNLFPLVPMGNYFWCYNFRKLLMYLALRKFKNDYKILSIILVPDFCPLKPEIARFYIRFHLKVE